MSKQKRTEAHGRSNPPADVAGAELSEGIPSGSPASSTPYRIAHRYSDSPRVLAADDPDDRRTQQEFFRDTNIHKLLERFQRPENIPYVAANPIYGDFTGLTDYRDAVERVRDADEAFLQLPAHVRDELEHDPGRLVDILVDHERGTASATQWLTERGFTMLDDSPEPSEGLPVATPPVASPPAPAEPPAATSAAAEPAAPAASQPASTPPPAATS